MKNVRNVKSGVPASGEPFGNLLHKARCSARNQINFTSILHVETFGAIQGDLWSWNFPVHT